MAGDFSGFHAQAQRRKGADNESLNPPYWVEGSDVGIFSEVRTYRMMGPSTRLGGLRDGRMPELLQSKDLRPFPGDGDRVLEVG